MVTYRPSWSFPIHKYKTNTQCFRQPNSSCGYKLRLKVATKGQTDIFLFGRHHMCHFLLFLCLVNCNSTCIHIYIFYQKGKFKYIYNYTYKIEAEYLFKFIKLIFHSVAPICLNWINILPTFQ